MRILTASYEDWIQLFVDGKLYFEGHSIPDHVWIGLLELFDVDNAGDVAFDSWGPLFAYGDVPRNENEVYRKIREIKNKENLGYRLNEWGEWTMDQDG